MIPLWLLISLLSIYGGHYDQIEIKTENNIQQAVQIERYLTEYGSPYYYIGTELVAIGELYNLDPAVLVAIFVLESSAGKQCFNGYNCMGFGDYFYDNLGDCFVAVARALSGEGPSGVYYQNKTLEEKIKTYNSVNPDYYPKLISIIEDVGR